MGVMLCTGSAGGRKREQDVGRSSPLETEVSTLRRNPSLLEACTASGEGVRSGLRKGRSSEMIGSVPGRHCTGGSEGEAWIQTGSLGQLTGLVAFVRDRDESKSSSVCSTVSQSIRADPA